MDPPQGSPTAMEPLMKVLSIPELLGHINQYLRFNDELRLRLVSKALCELYRPNFSFSQSIFTFPSVADKVASDNWIMQLDHLGPHIRSLCLVITSPSQNQRAMLEALYQHCGENVRCLTIEYWCDNTEVLEDILVHLPHVRELSITVMATMNVSKIPKAVINTRKTLHQLSKDGSKATPLLSLKIGFKVKHEGPLDWPLFKELLAHCPQLKTLSLAGVEFVGSRRDYMGNDMDNNDDDDNMNIVATLEQLDLMGLQYEEQSRATLLRPSMRTLILSRCEITERWLHRADKLFPNLRTLELDACGGQWVSSLASPLAQDKSVMFAHLESLTVFLEFCGAREDLTGFVRGRPHLTTLRTDVRSENREGILELARYCSGSDVSPVPAGPLTVRHKFKGLVMQTYWPTAYTSEELEQLYGEPCFQGLEYLFVQTQYLSMSLFPYAATLRSLHLGGEEHSFDHNRVSDANKILRQLPVLEVLVVERYLDGYQLFSGLGHEPGSQASWLKEGPFLKELEFFVQHPREKDSASLPVSRICDGEKINLQELEQQVVDRFKLLEKLRVHVHNRVQLPDTNECDGWKKRVWKKLGDDGVRTPSIDLRSRR